MKKIVVCVFVISLIVGISIFIFNVHPKHVLNKDNDQLRVTSKSINEGVTLKFQDKSSSLCSDEDIEYLQNKGWNIHHVSKLKKSRNARSIASIANCLWRVLNYPYMYNFYPLLNFGVGKIMTGIGDLINNVHFPLFSSSTSTTSQQPLSDSESQAQQLAYAQALSQESTTTSVDYTGLSGSDTSYNTPITATLAKTTSQEYQDEKDEEEEEEKEREQALRDKLRQEEVKKKIDAKAAILAKKYVQMYFSQNKQQLPDISLSNQNNLLGDTNMDLPNSLDNGAANPTTTDLYDLNALPNNVNNAPVYN